MIIVPNAALRRFTRLPAVLLSSLLSMILFSTCVSVHAADEPTPQTTPKTQAQLLQALTQASLSDTLEILQQLEALSGRDMLGLFRVMLDGNLFYHTQSLALFQYLEDSPDAQIAIDLVTGETLGDPVVWEQEDLLEKVRINNRLRVYLRSAIARVQLLDGSGAERLAAVTGMLGTLDTDSVALLQEARALEQDADVQEVLDVGIAMMTLRTSTDEQGRLDALQHLHGRLEGPVRNQLNALVAPDSEESSIAVRALAQQILGEIQSRVRFFQLMEQIFFGVSLGSVLLLAAIGLAVTFGVMGVINMAHGEMMMLGAYTTYVIQLLMPNWISASIVVALPAAFVVSALVGIFIQRYVIRYLNGRPLETLLATFGISLILQQTVRSVFSPLNRRVVSPDWLSGSLQINPVWSITYNRLYILIFSLVVFIVLLMILKKTVLGLQVRAVSQNRNMARAMGIRTDLVDAMTFGLGSGIAGIAGVALSQLTNVGPNLGQSYIIDSFMVVVFGGVGNLLGTLVAAFSLGIFNKFLEPMTGAVLANILILVFIILFIQKRPRGLFPQKGRAAE